MSIIDDLKKRKVIRTAIGYAIVAFVVMQIVEILFPIFNFPQWTQQFVIILLFLGFPVTVVISWMFDKTPDGVVKTVDNYKEQSFPWKISLIASILALVLYILFDNFNFDIPIDLLHLGLCNVGKVKSSKLFKFVYSLNSKSSISTIKL